MSSTVKIVAIPNRSTTADTEIDTGVPSTGSGWAAKSLQVISDRQGDAVAVLFDNSPPAVSIFNIEAAPVANDVVTKRYFFTAAARLRRMALWTETKPASALGTVLLTLKKNGSTTVLSAANYNTESLVDATYTALSLSGTAADLEFDAGDHLEAVHTSDNADMTGGVGFLVIGDFELI